MPELAEAVPCGSCGESTKHQIILRGQPVPACLRHTNWWRCPPMDYTCPTRCVEVNHPGREHHDWIGPCGYEGCAREEQERVSEHPTAPADPTTGQDDVVRQAIADVKAWEAADPTTGQGLAAWFHREFSTCVHPVNSQPQCEAWAEELERTYLARRVREAAVEGGVKALRDAARRIPGPVENPAADWLFAEASRRAAALASGRAAEGDEEGRDV